MATYCLEAWPYKCTYSVKDHFEDICNCKKSDSKCICTFGKTAFIYKTNKSLQKYVFLEHDDYGGKYVLDMPREIKLYKLAFAEDEEEENDKNPNFCKKCLRVLYPKYDAKDLQAIALMYLKNPYSIKELSKYINMTLGE